MAFPFVALALAIGSLIISYVIAASIPQPEPPEVQDLESPTSESGRPAIQVIGTIRIRSPNIAYFTDKQTIERDVNEGGGKK